MLDILIIGSGPAGLACAIAARSRGLSYLVLEKGSIVDAIRRFPIGMTYFSTSDMLEIGGVPFISSGFRPTRVESVRYYGKVVRSLNLNVQTRAEVTSVTRTGDHFSVEGAMGKSWKAHTVVVATGYFDTPNAFEIPGAGLPHVHRYYDEPFSYVGRKVGLVGGRNSVVDAALEMYREGVEVTIIHRGPQLSPGIKYWMLPDIEKRIELGQIRALFNSTVQEIRVGSLVLAGQHAGEIEIDDLFVLIGYSIEAGLLRAAGVSIDPHSMVPAHDKETFETNIEGLFVAGSIAAGKMNNKIFIENGRLHGETIMAVVQQRLSGLEK